MLKNIYLQISFCTILFLSSFLSIAQSVTLTPNGAWVPSMTSTARTALSATDGQLVYDSTTKSFWYFNATEWKEINTASGDNLGNHTATQNINIGANYLSNGNSNNGLKLNTDGDVTIKGSNFTNLLNIGDATNNTSIVSLKSIAQEWRIGVGDGLGDIFTITDETNDETPFVIGNNNESNILRLNNSKVGVNNHDPQETLDVSGKTKTTNFQLTNGATNGYLLQSDASGNASWVNSNSLFGSSNLVNTYLPKWNGGIFENSLLNENDNRLFFGTSSNLPDNFIYSKFTLAGSDEDRTDFNNVLATNSSNSPWINWGKARGTLSSMQTVLNNDDLFILNAHGHDGTKLVNSAKIDFSVDGIVATSSVPSRISFYTTTVGATGSAERFTIKNTGNVGIGTTSPTEKLDVSGKTKTTTFQMTNGATNGYILQADASGNGSWVNATSLANGNWTTSGSNQYSALIGNVGIGTSSPSSKLDIQGSGQITANIQSSGSHSYIVGSAPSGFESAFQFKTHSSGSNFTRWAFGKSLSAESGTEAGSDFFINRYNDAGSYLGTPLNISRSTGQVNIPLLSATTSKATTLNVSGAVTMAVSTKTASYSIGGTDYCVIFTGSTAGQTFTLPATPVTGRVLLIVNHSSQDLGLSPAVSSSATGTVSTMSAGNEIQMIYDGSNWRVIN